MENSCASCGVLKLQLELKDGVIKVKDEKITQLQDALVQAQKDLLAAKEEALSGYRQLLRVNDERNAINISEGESSQSDVTPTQSVANDGVYNHGHSHSISRRRRHVAGSFCNSNGDNGWSKSNGKNGDVADGEIDLMANADMAGKEKRAYIGHVVQSISRSRLKKELEDRFGRVYELDIIGTKHCAFVTFASCESFRAAVETGVVTVDSRELSIEVPKYARPSDFYSGFRDLQRRGRRRQRY
jgi:hypothetical protein